MAETQETQSTRKTLWGPIELFGLAFNVPEDISVDEGEARYDVFIEDDYDRRQAEEGDTIIILTTKGDLSYTYGTDYDVDDMVDTLMNPM